MTRSLASEARALVAAATKGPWCLHPNGTSVWTGANYDCEHLDQRMIVSGGVTSRESAAALELIARAPTLLSELADALESSRAECERLRGMRLAAIGACSTLERSAACGVPMAREVLDILRAAIDGSAALDDSGGSGVAAGNTASPVPDMPAQAGEQPGGGDTTSGDTRPPEPAGSSQDSPVRVAATAMGGHGAPAQNRQPVEQPPDPATGTTRREPLESATGASTGAVADPTEEPDAAVIVYYDDAHDGAGWYYYSAGYPDEGCCGRYESRDECAAAAAVSYSALIDEHGARILLPVPATRREIDDLRRRVEELEAQCKP